MSHHHQRGAALPFAMGLAAAVAALAAVLHHRARDLHQSTQLDEGRLGAWHAADSAEAWARAAWTPKSLDKVTQSEGETLELGLWHAMIHPARSASGAWTLEIEIVGLGRKELFVRPW